MALAMLRSRFRGMTNSGPFSRLQNSRYSSPVDKYDMFAGMHAPDLVRFEGYSETGFVLNNKVQYEGSIICLTNFTLAWTPKTFEEITPESLCIFELLRPAPDILVIGCGPKIEYPNEELRQFLRSRNIKIEAVSSRHAISTFTFLNTEGRLVAGAFLPCGQEPERVKYWYES